MVVGANVGIVGRDAELARLREFVDGHLIRTRSGARIPRPTLARLHEASSGNPMFALEFARSLGAPDRPQLGPMQVPASLHDLVRARVERYPHDVRRLLAIAAAAERPTPSLLATVDPVAAGVVERAVDSGAVTIGDDGIVRFTHPLLGSAVYADLAPSQRRLIRAKVARVARDLGWAGRGGRQPPRRSRRSRARTRCSGRGCRPGAGGGPVHAR